MQSERTNAGSKSSFDADPRWNLVERIVTSSSFAKSDRLCQFLLHVTELTLQGREGEINEINIGARLFGRANYDPSVDGIVRSHASRMRHRLDRYFLNEGAGESIRLIIPKGAYVPVFQATPVPSALELSSPEESLAEPSPVPPVSETTLPSSPLWAVRILSSALAVAVAVIIGLIALLHGAPAQGSAAIVSHPLWGSFFNPIHRSLVVCSDTSLTVLQDFTEHEVNLSDYINANYRTNIPPSRETTPDALRDIASRRYTAFADVGILTKLYTIPGISPERVDLRYAREVLPDDLKRDSVVLIGSKYSDPWVGLFEPHMNFAFRDDPKGKVSTIINRAPAPGEQPQYSYDSSDTAHKVYGVVALQPNLTGTDKVLILEGTTMAGTQAAADFVFDDHLLLPFLSRIRNSSGQVPFFELLLESNSINGTAAKIRILAYRISEV
jgi:hypothetical protein